MMKARTMLVKTLEKTIVTAAASAVMLKEVLIMRNLL
jgi:hypothetical protein